MKIKIKHRLNDSVLFETKAASMRLAVESAIRVSADLRGANLTGANLRSVNLGGANLSYADLSNADLGGAYLRGASLWGANLWGANLGNGMLYQVYCDEFVPALLTAGGKRLRRCFRLAAGNAMNGRTARCTRRLVRPAWMTCQSYTASRQRSLCSSSTLVRSLSRRSPLRRI